MFPSLQQKMELRQDLKAELSELLIQLDSIEYQHSYSAETQLPSRAQIQPVKMPSYALANLTNLLNTIDIELGSLC